MTHDSLVKRFLACLEGLNAWEAEIVTRVAEEVAQGAHEGLHAYGHWDPREDSRNLRVEARKESRDRYFYDIAGDIRDEVQRDTDPAPAPKQ